LSGHIDGGEVVPHGNFVFELRVPKDVPGIAFLSGGLSDEAATGYLSEMNRLQEGLPWNLTFSFGRGLQREPLKVFAAGGQDRVTKAQEILIKRAEETSLATLGKYNS
jgi:fructose-bisphosphate aldolase class I